MNLSYKERLKIPVICDNKFINFYTKSGEHIITHYNRIVIGQRGPYVELEFEDLIEDSFHVPKDKEYRINSDKCYYIELRSNKDNVKIYWQKRLVKYADYKIGKIYISPFDLFLTNNRAIILSQEQC
ncbi:hypothetical protein CMI47_12715 [Candidatus Pacearchaeota archaeon]|nr:hypothetical protein [Candidatus Pacearchaeota archaeon]|tara:strand:+ start:659 stop:1039 length:381 start_codon:yes stop_codon:yes gene_type:complete